MKKWYKPIGCDNTVANPFVADSEDLKGLDEWSFYGGQLFEKWDETVWFQAKESKNDGDPDDVLQNALGFLPIFSARLRKALDKAGITGIQYLPVHVLHYDGTPVEGFAIANILNFLPALDIDESDYDIFDNDYFLPKRRGKIRGIRKAVLHRTVIERYDIFRLNEFDLHIYVSELFRNVFVANGFTGYSFAEVKAL